MTSSEKTDQLIPALVAALAEMPHPPKDDANPHFNSRFASLPGVVNTVRPVLARHGLALLQVPGTGQRGPVIYSTLMHSSGQWMELPALEVPALKPDPQAYGSAITYGRRYALLAACGVAADDDDGNAAAQPPAPAKKPAARITPPVRPQGIPADGPALAARIRKFDSDLKLKGFMSLPGELTRLVERNGEAEGHPAKLEDYSHPANIEWACHEAVRLATERGWKQPEKKVG